jgi:hypothetical protein
MLEMQMSLNLLLRCTRWVVVRADVKRTEVHGLVTTGAAVIAQALGTLPYPFVMCRRKSEANKMVEYFKDRYIETKAYQVTWTL